MNLDGVYIKSVGQALGSLCVENKTLAASFQKDQEFIANRIGTTELPQSSEEEGAVALGLKASVEALKLAGMSGEDIQLVIFVTQNPDHGGLPHNSALIQAKLSIPSSAVCFDIGLGCSGFVYALSVAVSMMKTLTLANAIIITSDQYRTHLDPGDDTTQMLFGDAACATILSTLSGIFETKACRLGTDGTLSPALIRENNVIKMNGRAVFNFCRKKVPKEIKAFLHDFSIPSKNIDALILHQGSKAIVHEIQKALELDFEKVPVGIQGYGNTVSSSVPILLKTYLDKEEVSCIIISGFGVGLSWGTLWLQRKV